jgi:hypothetical protein
VFFYAPSVANFCSKCVENVPYRAREEEHWQLVAFTPAKHGLYGLKALESKIESRQPGVEAKRR